MLRLFALAALSVAVAGCASMTQRKYAQKGCAHTTGSLLCGDEDSASENVTSDANGPGLVAKTTHPGGS